MGKLNRLATRSCSPSLSLSLGFFESAGHASQVAESKRELDLRENENIYIYIYAAGKSERQVRNA